MYPNFCYLSGVHSIAGHDVVMLKMAWLAMLRLPSPGKPGRKRWCTAIVLIAVCTLTISVATRYGFTQSPADGTLTVVQKHHSLTPGLQRLLNNAATWIPPLVVAVIFQDLGHYSNVAPSNSPISSVLLESQLYNRPPPSVLFLS